MRVIRALLFCIGVLHARAVSAQRELGPASPFLTQDHWARPALEQLDAFGLITLPYDAAVHVLTRERAAELLADARSNAARTAPKLVPLVESYEARFREEYDAAARRNGGITVRRAGSEILLGYTRAAGVVQAGFGYDNATNWTGPRPVRDTSGVLGFGTLNALFGRYAAVSISPRIAGNSVALSEGYLALERWHLGAWAGRRGSGFGPGAGPGLLWNESVPLTGAGMFLPRPIHFPWFLHAMGWIHLESFIAIAGDTAPFREPWIFGARGSMTPHPRLTIGFNRAAMFGGSGNSPVTLKNLARTFVGMNTASGAPGLELAAFANQLLSADVRYRAPVPRLFPVLYGEIAMDDGAGMYHNVPGIRFGAYVPGLPGARSIALGAERASFAHSCCGNPAWYRNWNFRGGWAEEGRPLGHPLGGHGVEWRIYTRSTLAAARITVAADVFMRERGTENLFAPARAGRSTGAEGNLTVRIAAMGDLVLSGAFEQGERSSWTSSSLATGFRAHF